MKEKETRIQLIDNKSKCFRVRGAASETNIPIGTPGTIISSRFGADGKPQYLAKFDGHGGFRHCESEEITELNIETDFNFQTL